MTTQTQLAPINIWKRFLLACVVVTVVTLALAKVFLHTTGVPLTYPPLLPQQIIAGSIGGALLSTLGYLLFQSVIRDRKTFTIVFVASGLLLMVASYYLPWRLTYTTSPRFAGVTPAAQIAQAFLHTVVVVLSMLCLLQPASLFRRNQVSL